MTMQTTKELARGKWVAILSDLIGPGAVIRKHGPCPMCGGQDRYRFDNNNGDGDWFCNQCGVGDGFKLIQRVRDITFAAAASLVDDALSVHRTASDEPFKEVVNVAQRRENLNKLWASAKAPWVRDDYLVDRGIPDTVIDNVRDLRGISNMMDWDTKTQWPGMVGIIRNKKGEAISLHRTFFGMDSSKRKRIMPPIESITGAYIALGEPVDTLVIAEGIETALSGWAITGHPAWAMISAHNMEVFEGVPDFVKRVIICADHDQSFVGQAAAFKLASRLTNQKRTRRVDVWLPPISGHDMNDHLLLCRGTPLHQWAGSTL